MKIIVFVLLVICKIISPRICYPVAYLCGMELLDGKLASQAIKNELTLRVAELKAEGKKIPHLAAVLVGNNGASDLRY